MFAFIHPYILHGLEVYGNTCVSYMDKLTKMNNKLLQILQKKGRKCCNEGLYIQYGTLPPLQLFNYQVLSLVYKMVYLPHLLPPIFWDYFNSSTSVHTYNVSHKNIKTWNFYRLLVWHFVSTPRCFCSSLVLVFLCVILLLIAMSCHSPFCVRLSHSINRLLTYLLISRKPTYSSANAH